MKELYLIVLFPLLGFLTLALPGNAFQKKILPLPVRHSYYRHS